MKPVELDSEKLNDASKTFLDEFLSWRPEWLKYCHMEEKEWGFDLFIEVPSIDPNLSIVVWFEKDASDISFGFGSAHCHGDLSVEIGKYEYKEFTIMESIIEVVAGSLVGFEVEGKPSFDLLYLKSEYNMKEATDQGEIKILKWEEGK